MIPTNPQQPAVPLSGQNPLYSPNPNPIVPPPNPLQNQGPLSPFPTPGQFNTNPIISQPMPAPLPGQMSNAGNVEIAQPALNIYSHPLMSPPGWNDPPLISKSRNQVRMLFYIHDLFI